MAKRVVDEEMRFTVIINGDSAQKELYKLETANRNLTAANKDLRAEKAKLFAQGKKGTQAYKDLSTAIAQNNAYITTNKNRMKVLQNQIGLTGLTMRQLQQNASQLRLQLNNMVPGSAQYTRLQNDLKKVNTRISELRGKAAIAKNSVSGLSTTFSRFIPIIAGMVGFNKVFEFAKEARDLALQAKGVEFAFQGIEERTGDAEAALLRVKKSTRGLLSDLDIKTAIVELDNFNISTKETDTLLEFLAVRSAQTGIGIDKLKSSLVEGLSKESKLRIDNLGISAAELNTELAKTPNFVSAVANIAKKEIAEAGGILDEAANSSERFNASLKNAKLAFGKLLTFGDFSALGFLSEKLDEITLAFANIRLGVTRFTTAFKNLFTPFSRFLKSSPFLVNILNKLKLLFNTSGLTVFGRALNSAAGFVGGLANSIKVSYQEAKKLISAFALFGKLLANPAYALSGGFKKAFSQLKSTISNGADNIKEAFKNGYNDIMNIKLEPDTKPTLNLDTNIDTPTGDTSDSAVSKTDLVKKSADELLQIQRETEDQRLALIQDAFAREMAINDANQRRKIEDLGKKADELLLAFDTEVAENGTTDLASNLMDQYHEVLDQMDLSEVAYTNTRHQILTNGIENHIKALETQFTKEEALRLEAHNNALAALGNNEVEKQKLQDQYDKDRLERQKANEQKLMAELNKILDTSSFEGFSLDLLTDEQTQKIKDNLASLGLSLSEINALIANMQNGGGVEQTDILGLTPGNIDIFGFTVEDWEKTFTNLDTTKGKMEAVLTSVTAMFNAYKMFSDFQKDSEDARLEQLEDNYDAQKTKQANLLSSNLISQQQHDDAVSALDTKLEKEKAEIAEKQAKRDRINAMAGIALNTAQAIMSIWAQVPKVDFGISAGILTGFVSALGAAQMLAASKVKGYEQGFYGNTMAVRREQDGKIFNAEYGGDSRSGVVDKPTMFLAGEGGKNFPELIVSGPDLKQLDPSLKESLYKELGRIKGYENGYYKSLGDSATNTTNSKPTDAMLIAALNRTAAILEDIEANGIEAYLPRNFTNSKRLSDDLKRLQTLENKSKINA